ncbi:MAG: hypothetical protein ABJN42_24905 [Roseibium sp.]|uniref:hypothetical protein n=1 Tax=Roseibium sp. TaxID=1936156 RepID=UPI0032973900
MSQPVNGYIIQAEEQLWLAAIETLEGAEAAKIDGHNLYPLSPEIPEGFAGQSTEEVESLLYGDYLYEGQILLDVEDGVVALNSAHECYPVRWARCDAMLPDFDGPERELIENVQYHAVFSKKNDTPEMGL